ncbi:MAG: hypothetical protein ACXW6T_26230 [Candidatus Binatia bacterium]
MNQTGKMVSVDPIVAEAFFGVSSPNGPVSAERELMIAVLSDAIECFWKYPKSRAASAIRLYQDAKTWLFAGNENQPFSFQNICETLRLDPSYIRRGILTGGESALPQENQPLAESELGGRRNIKRKLKSGREWKGSARLSRQRVRPLRIRPRSQG